MGILITFLAVVIAWVLFRADNLTTAMIMLQKMSGLDGIILRTSVVVSKKRLLLSLCLFVWLVPNTMQLMGKYQPSFDYHLFKNVNKPWGKLSEWLNFKWKLTPPFGIIAGILLFIVVKSMLNAPESEFLYFNF